MHRRVLLGGGGLLAWVLMHAGSGGGWDPVGAFPTELTCMRVRAISISEEAQEEMGSALADQPFDNPMRQQAYARAEKKVGARYRCVEGEEE
jgi:hypothetical protein